MQLLCKLTAGSFLKFLIFLRAELPIVHQNMVAGGGGVVEAQSCPCQGGQKSRELKRKRKEMFLRVHLL